MGKKEIDNFYILNGELDEYEYIRINIETLLFLFFNYFLYQRIILFGSIF